MEWKISRRKFLISSACITGTAFVAPNVLLAGKRKVRFGVLTDSHYADREPSGTRYYRQSLDKMRESISILNQEKVDFVVHLGDFKDEDAAREEADTLRYLQEIEVEFAKFNGPRYHCIGNHDLDSISKEQFLQNTENTGIDPRKNYYSFDKKGYHFVVLDPNFHPDGTDHSKGDFEWFEANLPEEQWEWFEQDLNTTRLPTVVFSHFTLYEFFKGDAPFHITDFQRAQRIMEKSGNVIATFHGHVHDEDYTTINGIHYCTHYGMVDYSGRENNSFAIVTIDRNQLVIDGYYRCRDKALSLE